MDLMNDTIQREEPEGNDPRRALIERWSSRIRTSRKHWDKVFKRMRSDADFARGKQWPNAGDVTDDRYVANLIQRHIAQRVASLYAKNPRFVARRRQTLDFRLWDEKSDTLAQAMQTALQGQQMAAAGYPVIDPVIAQAMALIQDVQDGAARRQMLEKIGRTMNVLMQYQISEQFPPFKMQMKQLVRRTLTTCVGFINLGFERAMQPRPEDAEKIRDLTTMLTDVEQRIAAQQDGEGCYDLEVERAELAEQMRVLQENPQQIVREGLVFDFPSPTSVIVDKRCRQLQGFIGAGFIAREFHLAASEVERIYQVDVRKLGFNAYQDDEGRKLQAREPLAAAEGERHDESLVCVWEVQDKTNRTTFAIAEGCPVYLREPGQPEVVLDRFWTTFVLTFNDVEHEEEIYPPSDVELLRHQQMEHNRARQALREHRRAAAPGYAAPRGALTDDDKQLLADHTPHSTVELDGLSPTQKVADILQQLPKANIDPNLYETNTIFDDVLKVAGVQEAQIGGTSGATATEVSTAEGARMSSVASNVDDLDDLFNELARAAGQVLLNEIDVATAQKIAGPGAVWPELSRQEISEELMLEIEAGSTGKPNKAAEVKNFMDLAPILMQVPGIKPEFLAREGLRRLDDRLDLTDAFLDGLPSIQAMNRQAQLGTGNPATDPNAQGGEGGDNSPTAQSAAPQPNQAPVAGAAPNPGQAMSPLG